MDSPRNRSTNPDPPSIRDAELDRLLAAVHEAGRIALSYFGNAPKSERKADGSSVSEADLAVDAYLKKALHVADGSYGWLSEETDDDPVRLDKSRVWVVDPIDGTRAFLKDRPEWTISAALVVEGGTRLAAVYNPATEEFFHAVRGRGAFLNGASISVNEPMAIAGCRLAASATMFRPERWPRPWPDMKTVWINSIAYRLALVAAGKCDGTVSLSGKNDWDIAAADLLVREAGGRVTTHDGKPFVYNQSSSRHRSIVAAGPTLHAELIERTSQATI